MTQKMKITYSDGSTKIEDKVMKIEPYVGEYSNEEELLSYIKSMTTEERRAYVFRETIPVEYEKIFEALSMDADTTVRFYYVQYQKIPAKYKNVHDNLCRDDDIAIRRQYCAFQSIPSDYYEIHERLGSDPAALVRLTYAANLTANPTVVAYMKYTRKI